MQASMGLTPRLLNLSICHIECLECNSSNEVHTESCGKRANYHYAMWTKGYAMPGQVTC